MCSKPSANNNLRKLLPVWDQISGHVVGRSHFVEAGYIRYGTSSSPVTFVTVT